MKEYILGDCMDHLVNYKDNHFDLAVVDPPYGIGLNAERIWIKKNRNIQYNERQKNNIKHKNKGWDVKPAKEYFKQLIRVSKNQIVCGAYMFTNFLPVSKSWIVWDKKISNDFTLSSVDLFWTSTTKGMKKYTKSPLAGCRAGKDRIHPTQKPVALYRWILQNYAKPNDLILDTHVGSASSLIACHMEGFDYVGFEKDEDYFRDSTKRLQQHLSQIRMF